MTSEQKEELKKYTPGTPEYVYFHGRYSIEIGLSYTAVLNLKGNNYYNKEAFEIASKLIKDKDKTL